MRWQWHCRRHHVWTTSLCGDSRAIGAIVPTKLLMGRASRSGGAPGTTKRWVNPSPAQTPRQLVIHGGFVVDDRRARQLERRARRLGFTDLRGYLQAGSAAGLSIPRLAAELGVTPWTVKRQLTRAGVTLHHQLSGWPVSVATPPTGALPHGPPSWASTTSRRTWPTGSSRGRGR
jgi:hypothetical protein